MVPAIGTHLLAAVSVMPIPAAVSPRRATRTLGLLWKVSTSSCLSFGCDLNNGINCSNNGDRGMIRHA